MTSRAVQIASLPVFLFLGTTAAWAGRGDIDPNYGEGGRVSIPPSVTLALPGDRLAIAETTDAGLRVRMIDAAGHSVPTFGEGGSVLINSPALGTFEPAAAALAPNGDMIFLGVLGDAADTLPRAILRLDSAGQPVASFGTRGDGFVEPALARARALAFAVDPDGKIVLGEGSWDGDVSCDSIARVQRLGADGQLDAGFGGDGLVEIPDLDICNGAPLFSARADGSVVVGDGHTLVAVDAAGEIDPAFGVDGRLVVSELNQASGLLLPDGGLLMVGSDSETGSSNTVLQRFDRNGQPDLGFGGGTGSVTVDLGAPLGMPSAREHIEQLMLDPDSGHFVAELHLAVSSGNGSSRLLCRGITRLSIDGTLDTGFGRDGLTCLNLNVALIAVQGDGAPLFFAGDDSAIHRLLPDNSPSPGFLRIAVPRMTVSESSGAAAVTIERLAGRDGAVSADFATIPVQVSFHCGYSRCTANHATAGSDYSASSGRLDWADGDESQREIAVGILNDDSVETWESFGVQFSELAGGVALFGTMSTVLIDDDDEATTPPPPPPPPPPASGGGGSVSWATPLALLALLLMRRRRERHARLQRATTAPTANRCE